MALKVLCAMCGRTSGVGITKLIKIISLWIITLPQSGVTSCFQVGIEWPIDMQQKGCESSIHDHDIDFIVTMVGWVDVPDSDRDEFRHHYTGYKSCNYIILPWVAYYENMLTFPLSDYRIDNVDLWLCVLEEWELQIWNWSTSVQLEIAPLFTISLQLKKKAFFSQKSFPCDAKEPGAWQCRYRWWWCLAGPLSTLIFKK